MNRIRMFAMCLLALMATSLSLKAQEITITLSPNWNWISYPNAVPMELNEALGDFVPAEGDMIKSQYGFSSYHNGYWLGGLTHFMPGKGYVYYSSRSELTSFVFAQPSSSFVATAMPTDITTVSAVVGGTVTIGEGNHLFARGVCWGTEPNPTIDGSHYAGDNVAGSQSFTLNDLTIDATYYVRAYAVTDYGLAYGEEVAFSTKDGIPVLATYEVTGIGMDQATCGGEITDDGGLEITARGVCWSTAPNPTVADAHTADGTGIGSYVSTMTGLTSNTTYYVRAYATNSHTTAYGEEVSFTTESGDHDYVDLGLPSGLLWATCNVGATAPEEPGDYFAWGETQPKDFYDESNYQYYNGNDMTKYTGSDGLTTLLPEDDAATANWGDGWRMPTKTEWQELYNNTTVTWTQQNGVNGRLFTATNGSGNSLFLPAAGYFGFGGFYTPGSNGRYWSSSLYTDNPYSYYAWNFVFGSSFYYTSGSGYSRTWGHSVRPVRSGQNNAPTGAINGKFTINEDGGQVYFSQGNLQYQASTNTWKFADNQWDYVGTQNPSYGNPGGTVTGSDNSNISSTYSGWIDLFSWGTSGYNHGANCYQPWSTSQTSSEYYAYGSYTYNLYDQTGQADWGYNPISNGGNTANQWRTLTQPEWNYVFNTRTTTSGIRYAKANVNNVNGMILLPDDWSSDTYSLSNTNSSGASYSSNTLTASQWSTLEQAGAVFLPAAGYRYGTSVEVVGSNGYYWSASYSGNNYAYSVLFTDSGLSMYGTGRCLGFCVRVVCPAEN